MGKIVGAIAASHSPGVTGWPERADSEKRARIEGAFGKARRFLEEVDPDVVVAISVEHFTNFNFGNLPAFAIATADSYLGPVTQEMSEFLRVKQRQYQGDGDLGRHIYEYAIRNEFDPALVEGGLDFDENFCVPLKHLDPEGKYPLVPIIVNGVNPPWPTANRSYAFGEMVARAVGTQDRAERVFVLATGGLSHWVGLPEAGTINEDFDRDFIRRLESNEPDQLRRYSPEEIDAAGNGAHEVRTWIAAAGAVQTPFRLLAYEPVPEWLTGTAVAMADPALST